MSGAIPPLPNTPSWSGAQLQHRDTLPFTVSPPNVLHTVALAHSYEENLHVASSVVISGISNRRTLCIVSTASLPRDEATPSPHTPIICNT
jgi:hypothetical protein